MKKIISFLVTALIFSSIVFFGSSTVQADPSFSPVQAVTKTKRKSKKVYKKGRWVTVTTWRHGKKITKKVWRRGNAIGHKTGRKTKEIMMKPVTMTEKAVQ
jgi:hypothetical protein